MLARVMAALVVSAGFGIAAAAQTTAPPHPPLAIKSVYGRDLYEFYCATCHGRGGRGDGPVASALKTAPTDLTALSMREGGTFPRDRLIAFIDNDGAAVAAHGSKEMPVWGPIFRSLDPSDTMARIRIENVVDYLATLQRK